MDYLQAESISPKRRTKHERSRAAERAISHVHTRNEGRPTDHFDRGEISECCRSITVSQSPNAVFMFFLLEKQKNLPVSASVLL